MAAHDVDSFSPIIFGAAVQVFGIKKVAQAYSLISTCACIQGLNMSLESQQIDLISVDAIYVHELAYSAHRAFGPYIQPRHQ